MQDGNEVSGYYDRAVHQISTDGHAYRCSSALDFRVATRYQITGEVRGSPVILYETGFEILRGQPLRRRPPPPGRLPGPGRLRRDPADVGRGHAGAASAPAPTSPRSGSSYFFASSASMTFLKSSKGTAPSTLMPLTKKVGVPVAPILLPSAVSFYFAKAFKCRWLVVENVVGMKRWSRYAEFKKDLVTLGYKLCEQVLNSAAFGVAQSRRRLFLVADRHQDPKKLKPRKRAVRNASKIVNLNGGYEWTPVTKPKRAKATLERFERGIVAIGKNKPFLIVYYGSDHSGGWQPLNRPLRTITTVDRFAVVRPDPIHGHVMRMLQVPELQAAMGMPSKMKLEAGTRRDRIKMIGNAVCPPVMKSVVSRLTSVKPSI